MTDLSKTTNPDLRQETSEPVAELAHTLLHGAPTVLNHDANGSKQSCDLAFAIAMLQLGYTNTRSLALATRNWTTNGNLSLAEHLLNQGVISAEQRATIEIRANRTLQKVGDHGLENPATEVDSLSQSVRERHWLNQLDPSGKIAKLLGIADTSVLADHEIEDRQLGSRYTLLRKLGQGGLGVVWLARDQNLQRYVAVKEMSQDVISGDVALDHFRREAEITGRLEHPGIVPVHQYGEDEASGKSFYVMRFLGKRTLQDAITEYHERRETGNDSPMMLHRLLSALINVSNAVGHAHSRKVIHRDLKPENVAIDEFGQVTLLDWGLAMINDATGMYEVNGRTEPGDLHSVGSTQVGRVLGTPLYMSPEQAAGRLDEVDELTDVYALGGILYAILTGMAPHQREMENADAGSNLSDMMSAIVSSQVTPTRQIVASVPPELDAVCMKALASKRYLRYESARELEEEIQRYISGTPVEAYTPPARQRISHWMAKHPTLTQSFLLGASLLLICGAAIAYTAHWGQTALQQAQYASVQEFTRELEENLNFETEGMVRNLHFVTELPLMEAIVIAQQRESQSNLPTLESQPATPTLTSKNATLVQSMGSITLDDLLARQGHLFDGLLNANPAYLVACTCVKRPDGLFDEANRSERVLSGRRVHRIPRKQLRSSDPQENTPHEAAMLDSLRSDQVLLITNDQLSEDVPLHTRSPLVLSGVQAVFDTEGELFGLNIIELDLRQRLKDLFTAVAPNNVSVCVTDMTGTIVQKYENGRFQKIDGRSITEEFPILRPFFESGSTVTELGDGKAIFARRVQLGGSTKAQIGIITHIQDE